MRAILLGALFGWSTLTTMRAQVLRPSVGELPTLTFTSEQEPYNFIVANLSISIAYNDNVLLTSPEPLGDTRYEIGSGVAVNVHRGHYHWTLSASPTFVIDQNISQFDLLTNVLGTTFEYYLSRRLTASFRGAFVTTNNPFYEVEPKDNLPDFNLLDQPNDFVIAPQARTTTGQAVSDLIYEIGPRSMFQVSGIFSDIKYHNLVPSAAMQLTDSQSATGRALYSRRISHRHSAGFVYDFKDLAAFGANPTRTIANSFLCSYSLDLKHSFSLQIVVGPEHSRTSQDVVMPFLGGTLVFPVTGSAWSWAGGATTGWRGRRGSIRAEFLHQIQNGGGLPMAAHHTSGGLELRHKLWTGWVGNAALFSVRDQLLELSSSKSSREFIGGSAGVTRRLGKDLSLDLRYSRAHQQATGPLLGGTGNIDRVSASLTYQFRDRLGN
jgi:hypothetical protein